MSEKGRGKITRVEGSEGGKDQKGEREEAHAGGWGRVNLKGIGGRQSSRRGKRVNPWQREKRRLRIRMGVLAESKDRHPTPERRGQ